MKLEQAETIALQGLTFIAGDEDRLDRFLALSGLGQDDLRDRITDPAFLGGILDHLLAHEPDLIAFADGADLPPEMVMRARAALPGFTPEM